MQQPRRKRVRRKLRSKSDRPRLSVFVSNKHIYAQVIDDKQGKTLAAARDVDGPGKRIEVAARVGEIVARQAIKAGVKEVVFDRGGKKYHGRIKALAQGARKGGLEF